MRYGKIIIACLAAAILSPGAQYEAKAWGQKGHDVTCAIAQKHLSCKAKKEIARILDGRSIIYWSSWMDNASHTPEYSYTKTWHYKDIDAGYTYETMPEEPEGDVVTAIKAQIKALKSGALNKEAEALALKMLIHFAGDLHCPMHLAHKDDLGGNRWQVQFFGKGTNLHSVWDGGVIERSHSWTYSEWVEQLDICDRRQIREITQGSIDDWAKQTYEVAGQVYDATPVGANLSYDYVTQMSPVAEQQLLRGGLRLAKLLNEIFR